MYFRCGMCCCNSGSKFLYDDMMVCVGVIVVSGSVMVICSDVVVGANSVMVVGVGVVVIANSFMVLGVCVMR